MSEPITSSFLKEIKNPITLLIIGMLAIFIAVGFISFQVYNHLPTQMDRIEKRIDRVEDKIDRLEVKMDGQYRELNQKMDSQYNELNNKMDKLLYYLIDNKGKN